MTPVAACRSCGTEPLENARFCHGCGSPVAAGDTHAEYKQVPVLFADVVHSMSIAAVVGAERLREIMAELVNRASVIVQRYRANVDQFTGDGIMAVFGAPAALEDHAFRACLAALEIQMEVQGLAADIDRRDGVELRLRIGLNSGQVRGQRCKAKAREALLNRPLPAALASTITPDFEYAGFQKDTGILRAHLPRRRRPSAGFQGAGRTPRHVR